VTIRDVTVIDEQGRPEPPLLSDELGTLQGFLEFQRATFAWKCRGLDAAGLNTRVGVSSMTLGGMLKHLAFVEDHWCGHRLHGRPRQPPFDAVDWDAHPDWDWSSAADDSPEELWALWEATVVRSQELVASALAEGGLDQPSAVPDARVGAGPNLRWILVHLIEEYARHNGHADLLREAVDGETGE
jgi:hypothetical protein